VFYRQREVFFSSSDSLKGNFVVPRSVPGGRNQYKSPAAIKKLIARAAQLNQRFHQPSALQPKTIRQKHTLGHTPCQIGRQVIRSGHPQPAGSMAAVHKSKEAEPIDSSSASDTWPSISHSTAFLRTPLPAALHGTLSLFGKQTGTRVAGQMMSELFFPHLAFIDSADHLLRGLTCFLGGPPGTSSTGTLEQFDNSMPFTYRPLLLL
jgi:hypothetical protein